MTGRRWLQAAAVGLAIVVPPVRYALRRRDVLRDLTRAIVDSSREAAQAWPGYEPLDQPLLVYLQDGGAVLFGASRPPHDFTDLVWAHSLVAYSSRTFSPSSSFISDYSLDGATVTAVSGGTSWNAYQTTSYFVHERFHRYQDRAFKPGTWHHYPVEDPADIALAAVEGDSLAAWLENGDPGAIRDFAAARAERRRRFPGSAVERGEERLEGTAKFVEWTALDVSSSPAALLAHMAQQLRRRATVFDMAKWRHYEIGATLCRWLDAEKVPNWRRSVEDGAAPSDLVLARLALQDAEIKTRLARLTRTPSYLRTLQGAPRAIATRDSWREDALRQYTALKGRRLFLRGSAAAAAFDGDSFDYPDDSCLLSARYWVVDRPEIQVRLRDHKGVMRRLVGHVGTAEFVVPPDAVVTLDGVRWAFSPGRHGFRTLSISSAPRVSLTAGPGVLEDDGRTVRLSFSDAR